MWNRSSLANVLLLSCLSDRTEMAHSVEARTPFLDRHLTDAGSALRSMTEKWILREAVRPYITEKLYQRKKHTFLTPTKWPRDGALHNLFRTLLTRRAVEGPGFVDHGAVQDEVKRAFGDEADAKSSRVLCYVGSWVTLAQRFGVKKASVED
ncbi:putative asparagine synthase [Colletotrichum sublineola]|uniref:Putative asparagine synthase n=1 Tax=Colletotrichum sublineola TaxID=1173701 RepID=A0A066XFI7_COLSU|nr:putative asparagine synthase [Colletotrichum sublineola]